mgnify:CR=1 FL=1|tara:strand:- start:116 stop:367 length:252 start_codon:yes stop_codon:yes gene_type:complete
MDRPVLTHEHMSRFEFAKIVGIREMQLSSTIHQDVDPHKQAVDDVLGKKLAWLVRRDLPGNRVESVDIRCLLIPPEFVESAIY